VLRIKAVNGYLATTPGQLQPIGESLTEVNWTEVQGRAGANFKIDDLLIGQAMGAMFTRSEMD